MGGSSHKGEVMGIIAKIWNIKAGSQGRSGGAQIGSSIDYITNSEKCSESIALEGVMQMGREVSYVTNDIKTLEGLYVGTRHITDVENATAEMMQVKEFYKKLDGRVALHGIISLDEEESDKANAGKLMFLLDELMEYVFPEHQVVYAVHTNTENLHIHFIANTVGLDGKKIHMDKSFMRHVFEPKLNALAIKYGFNPNEEWMKEKKKDEVSFKDRKIMLRKAIDFAVEEAEDFASFVQELREMGLIINIGKHLSLRMDGMSKAVRSNQLGDGYTLGAIRERIETKRDPFIGLHMKHHVKTIEKKEVVNFVPTTLKKYKDMTPEEKKKTVQLLRMGRNPWRERYEDNWQIERMSSELNSRAMVYDVIQYFSPVNHDTTETKEAIVALQKVIAEEKTAIKANLRKYKPIAKLYEEIKKHEVRAYLYEFAECKEYEEDYLKYKMLCTRLEEKYEKTLEEVAVFLEDQKNQLLYAKEQANELSEQYKAVIRFEKEASKGRVEDEITFYDAVGHSAAVLQAREYGIYETRLVSITADDVEDISIRVFTTSEMLDGKPAIVTSVAVLDKDGKELESISSKDYDKRGFNRKLNDMKYEYGFMKCHVKHIRNVTEVETKERTKRR